MTCAALRDDFLQSSTPLAGYDESPAWLAAAFAQHSLTNAELLLPQPHIQYDTWTAPTQFEALGTITFSGSYPPTQ